MYGNDEILFETLSGNKYKFCSKTSMVVKESDCKTDNDLNRKELWENFYSDMYKDYDHSIYQLNTAKEVEEYLYRNGFRQLLLEVTEKCNLRCKYCSFSGSYEGQRSHGSKEMSWEIAKKAIDMYETYYREAKTFNPNLRPVIGFYGGEPLLNFKLIQKCLEYIKTLFKKEDNIYLNITTNATLLNEEIIKYFHKEGVVVGVSIDGDKQSHDTNRVFKDGEGTFDLVMDNVYEMNRITGEPVYINTVYDLKTDLKEVFKFLDEHPNLWNIGISPVNPNGTDYYNKFSKKDLDEFYNMQNELLEDFIKISTDKELQNKLSKIPFVMSFFGQDCSYSLMRNILQPNRGVIKYTGTCIPGNKIFVDTVGNFHMCEKVSREWCIGNVNSGLNFEKVLELINTYNKTISKCESCVIRNCCSHCFMTLEEDGDLKIDSEECKKTISNYKRRLELTYSILEKNPFWFRFFLDEYYEKVRNIGGIKGC